MATAAAEIEFIPDEPTVEFIPDEPQSTVDFIPDEPSASPELIASEAQRATGAALQAVDSMAAPTRFDWSDVNERFDTERERERQGLLAQAQLAEDAGSGTGPGSEAFGMRNRAFELRNQMLDTTTAGRAALESEGADLAAIRATDERTTTPAMLLSGLMGPGLRSSIGPVAESFSQNVTPALGGVLGAAAFATPQTGIPGMIISMLGGLMGAQTGANAQEAVLQSAETPEETAARQTRWQQDAQTNPNASMLGTMAATAPFFRPSFDNIGKALYGNRAALANIGITSTIGGATEAALAKLEGRPIEGRNIALSALGNALLSEPTRLGRALGFKPTVPSEIAEYAVYGPREDLESGLTTRGTTSTADVFANVPRTTQPTTPDAQQIPETAQSDGGVLQPEVPQQNEQLPANVGGQKVQEGGQGEVVAGMPQGEALPGEVTGIRNAIVDERRRVANMAAREVPAREAFGTILDEAKAAIAQDPDAGRRLVSELKESVRPLTSREDAILTVEQNRRELAREEAIDAVNNAATEEERIAAQQKLAFADNEAFEIYQVGQNAGTENARGLNARRLMLNRDYTLAKMLNETRALRNDGKPLTPEQTTEVTNLHKRIAELEGKLSNKEAADAQKQAVSEYENILRQTKEEAKVAAKEKRSVVDFLNDQAEKARQRIIARRGRLQTTLDPLNIAGLVDEAIIGASYVAKGIRDFGEWSKQMLSEFGERIRPSLQPLFDKSVAMEAENAAALSTQDTRTPAQVLAESPKFTQKTVYDLARAHVRAGVDGFENVMAAVEADLKPLFPDVTQRQIRDTLSKYGQISKPSQEADLKKMREYRTIARLMSQLEDAKKGITPLKTGAQRDKATARVRELQKEVNDAMAEAGLKRSSEDQLASSLDAAKTRLRNATEELQRKINKGDYSERPKREQPVDIERINLEFDLAKVKQEYQEGLIKARRAKRTTGEKIWDAVTETFNLSRQLLTSGDFPPVFRQGLFSIGRPKIMASALKNGLEAMLSEKKRFAVEREIFNRPNAPLYQRAKLYLAKDVGQPLAQQEEAYMGNWFKQLPRWTVVGPLLRASERTYNTFLNKLRADTFDAAVKAYDIAPTDTADLRALADVINTFTGRAKLPGKKLEQGAAAMNTFLFAPRFLASRFKIVTGQPLWGGTSASRKFAMAQYAKTLAGASIIYGLASMAGAEIETDPRSTDFLKIKLGDTRIDPLGGLIQVTTFLTRIISGETKDRDKKVVPLREDFRPLKTIDKTLGTTIAARGKPSRADAGSVIGKFLRTKLNPVAGAAVDIVKGESVTGEKITPASMAVKMTTPISFQEIGKTMEEQGVPRGTALWILSLFGAGLNTYGNRQK